MSGINIRNMTLSYGGRPIQAGSEAALVMHRPRKANDTVTCTATATIKICSEDWRDILAEPPRKYRVVDGLLQMSVGSDLELQTANGLKFQGVPWFDIGTTRGPERTDRLRKFVRRNGRLVEVRTRGRTGAHSLAIAVEQAGVTGLALNGGHMTLAAMNR